MLKQNPKILFPFVGDTIGGSHISAWQLITTLRNFPVVPVILVHRKGRYLQWLHEQGGACEIKDLPYIRLNTGPIKNLFRILLNYRSAKRVLKTLEIDLIHCNDSRMNRTWAPWAKAAGIPMVWHQRAKWIPSRQAKASIKFASATISISHFVSTTAPTIPIPNFTIYNPVSIPGTEIDKIDCSRKLRVKLGLSNECKLVGCFGNSQRWKRPDTFFHAARLLQKQFPRKSKFIWCGDDRDGILDRLIESTSPNSPAFRLPFQSNVLSIMAGCDIIIAPSEGEPFGRTLVEAMSVGVPVVASNSGGHVEIVKDELNGLLFPVGDYQACVAAILRLFSENHLYQRIVNNAKKSIVVFDPDEHARKIFNVYNLLLQRSKQYS